MTIKATDNLRRIIKNTPKDCSTRDMLEKKKADSDLMLGGGFHRILVFLSAVVIV